MKLIYIAGPYRAEVPWEVQRNIHAAQDVAADIARNFACMDVFPVVPHANTAHFDGLASGEYFLEGTKELLRRCDAIFLLPEWQRSSGSRAELHLANELGLPSFQNFYELAKWLGVA